MNPGEIQKMLKRDMERVNTEHSFALLNAFYTACLLRQIRGEEWSEESILKELHETRRKILEAL